MFQLHEIVEYIQHKVGSCEKKEDNTEDVDMEEEAEAAKEIVEKCVGSPSVTGSGQHDDDDLAKENNDEPKEADSAELLKERRLDAETNTINSGECD